MGSFFAVCLLLVLSCSLFWETDDEKDDVLLFWVPMGSAAQDKPAQSQLLQRLEDSIVLIALFRFWDGLM